MPKWLFSIMAGTNVLLLKLTIELERIKLLQLQAISSLDSKVALEYVSTIAAAGQPARRWQHSTPKLAVPTVQSKAKTSLSEWNVLLFATSAYKDYCEALKCGVPNADIKRKLKKLMKVKREIKKQLIENEGTPLSDESKSVIGSCPTLISSSSSAKTVLPCGSVSPTNQNQNPTPSVSETVLPCEANQNQSPKTPSKSSATQTAQLPNNTSLVSSEKVERAEMKKIKKRALNADRKAKNNDNKDQIEQEGYNYVPVRSISPSIRLISSDTRSKPIVARPKDEVAKALQAQLQCLGPNQYNTSFPEVPSPSNSPTRFLKVKNATCDTFIDVASRDQTLNKSIPANVGQSDAGLSKALNETIPANVGHGDGGLSIKARMTVRLVKPVDVPKNQLTLDNNKASRRSWGPRVHANTSQSFSDEAVKVNVGKTEVKPVDVPKNQVTLVKKNVSRHAPWGPRVHANTIQSFDETV